MREASNPKTLETYISGRGGKQFDVSILSSDGEYAALVGEGELATFRYAGDDRSRDKFEIAAIHKLGERYKPIVSASRTWFAIVAKEKVRWRY